MTYGEEFKLPLRSMRRVLLFFMALLIGLPNVALATAGFGDHDERIDVHDLWPTPEYNRILFFWNTDGGMCTAQYVWYNIVLTARHCIVYETGHDGYKEVGQVIGKIRNHALNKSEVVVESYGYDRADDWALLRITDPNLYSDNWFDVNPQTITQTLQSAGFGWCRVLQDSEIDKIKFMFLKHPYYRSASFAELWDGMTVNGKKVDGIKDQAINSGIPDLDDFDESTKTNRLKAHRNCNVFADYRNSYYAQSDCDITQGNSGGPVFNGKNFNGIVSSVISGWRDRDYSAYMLRTERYKQAVDKLRQKYPLSSRPQSQQNDESQSVTPNTDNNVVPDTPSGDNEVPTDTPKRRAIIRFLDEEVTDTTPMEVNVGETKVFKVLHQGGDISTVSSDESIASVKIKNGVAIRADLTVTGKKAGTTNIILTTEENERFRKTLEEFVLIVKGKSNESSPEPSTGNSETGESSGGTDVAPVTPSSPETGGTEVAPNEPSGSDETPEPSQGKEYAILKVDGLYSNQVMKVGGFKIAEIALNTGGPISVSLSNEGVVTTTFTGSELRIVARSAGTTVLTLTAAETEHYRETSKEYTITVTDGLKSQFASSKKDEVTGLFDDDDIDTTALPALQQKVYDLDSELTDELPEIQNMTRMGIVSFLERAVYYDRLRELRDKYEQARARELAPMNKILSALSIGATGIGGMMAASALSEQRADEYAERSTRAYMNTMRCDYGNGKSIKGGETNVELPGGNDMAALYTEYAKLANDLKMRKDELGIRPGIEAEVVIDKASTGLYDDVGTGITGGAYASVYRALTNPDGEDAKAWNEQKDQTSKKLGTGATVAGVGALGGMVGNIIINGPDGHSGILDVDDEDEGVLSSEDFDRE